jgi:hypothetical protein
MPFQIDFSLRQQGTSRFNVVRFFAHRAKKRTTKEDREPLRMAATAPKYELSIALLDHQVYQDIALFAPIISQCRSD